MKRSVIGIIALLVILMIPALDTFAQDVTNQSPSPSPAATASAPSVQESPKETKETRETEVAALRAQLELSRQFHESILDTVYWALGGTFVLVGLLLGFGWFANFKVYERDKAAMKAELEALLLKKFVELEGPINRSAGEIPTLVADEVAKANADAQKPMINSVASLSRRITEIEIRHLKQKMQSNPSHNMALTDALGLLKLCEDKSPDDIPEILKFMMGKIDAGGKLTAGEITRLLSVLDKLPKHYSVLVEKLRAKLVASDIF